MILLGGEGLSELLRVFPEPPGLEPGTSQGTPLGLGRAEGVPPPEVPASCTDTGLANGTAYYYKIFAKDTNGNYATGATPTGSPVTPNVTTLGSGTDPSNSAIAPSGTATMADAFTFQTASGTDSITAVTVTLASGTSGGLSLVEITDTAGSTVYGSATNPGSDTPAITLSTARMSLTDPLVIADGWRLIVVAAMANLISKAGIAGLLGGWRLLGRIALLFTVPMLGGAALLVLM